MVFRISVIALLFFCSFTCWSQSKTTQELQSTYKDSRAFFFYNNTLRMINQQEDKAFDEMIRDIEKMKFLMVKKSAGDFNYKHVVDDYKSERFEEVMTSRHQGKNFDVFVREKNGETQAMLVLVNDPENLFVLDIVGSIPLDKVTKLYSEIDESSDIGRKIQKFVEGDKKDEEKSEIIIGN